MKNSYKIIISTVILTFLISCKKQSPLDFEKEVMAEIFDDVIDSLAFDRRIAKLMYEYPFGEPVYDSKGNYLYSDSTAVINERAENRIKIEEVKRDTLNLFLAIKDSTYKIKDDDVIDFKNHFKNIIVEKEASDSSYFRLELKKYYKGKKFKYKYLSEFPDRDTIWTTNYKFEFAGIMMFSKIKFDKTRNYGVLKGGGLLGRLNGQGFIIFIKQVNKKWIIDKIKPTWVS